MSNWSQSRAAAKKAGRDQVLVGGKDVTFFRGAETQWTDYELFEPFGYGPTALTFPKIHAALEQLGVGELAFLQPNAQVVINRRDVDTDELIATDYVGILLADVVSGKTLTMQVGGQFTGPASTIDKHQRAFRYVGDVGHLAALCVGDVGLHMEPWNGPVTGVRMVDSGADEPLLSWAATVCAMSLTTAGVQRAIMPDPWGSSTYTFKPKNTTTIDCTIFADDNRMVLDLRNDAAEQPNRWFITGITPEGVRIRNIRYPGLIQGPAATYPIAGGASFTIGKVDADTVNGDGISVMQIKLQQESYYGWNNPITGVFDAVTAEAVMRLKADVGLTVNGTMTVGAWDRLWDIAATGFSLNGAKAFPVVEDPRVRRFNYSSNGSVVGANPLYDPKVLPVERKIDFGPGWTKQQMVDWCRGEQARTAGKNWYGTITLNEFSCWAGEWGPDDADFLNADPATGYAGHPEHIMSYRDLRPGMNVKLPLFDGGTVLHIAGVKPSKGNNKSVVLTVDTQARDRLEIAALISRNAEARRHIRREWYASNRPGKPSNNMVPRDEFFGRLRQKVAVPGGRWVAYPVPAGQSGTINRVHVQLVDDLAEFAMVIVGNARSEKALEHELNRRIPNPLAAVADGADAWYEKDKNKDLFRSRNLLYAAGTHDQPCGVWPRKRTNAAGHTTSAAVTGEWIYDNPFPYLTGTYAPGVVWVAIYADRDTHVKAGLQLWAQEDDNN